MATMAQATELLHNASLFKAANEAYAVSLGIFFWPIIFLFTLFVVYIKTENPAYVAVYGILGNVILASFLPIISHPIFYVTVLLTLAMVLWSFFGSSRID